MAYPQHNAKSYARYSNPNDVASLDLNTIPRSSKYGTMHAGLYAGQPFHEKYYICGDDTPRNSEFHYIMDRERKQHPDHFSHFGYGNCMNGYCFGRATYGYIVPPQCEPYEPRDMAPPHLYPTEEDKWHHRVRPQVVKDSHRGPV